MSTRRRKQLVDSLFPTYKPLTEAHRRQWNQKLALATTQKEVVELARSNKPALFFSHEEGDPDKIFTIVHDGGGHLWYALEKNKELEREGFIVANEDPDATITLKRGKQRLWV